MTQVYFCAQKEDQNKMKKNRFIESVMRISSRRTCRSYFVPPSCAATIIKRLIGRKSSPRARQERAENLVFLRESYKTVTIRVWCFPVVAAKVGLL